MEYIQQKFGFVTSVVNSINQIRDSIGSSGSPPVIEVNLASSTSKYDYGNTALVLDLSWYAPYKDTVDTVVSSILWVCFLWRLFVHLPGIISGMSGTVTSVSVEPANLAIEDKSMHRRK